MHLTANAFVTAVSRQMSCAISAQFVVQSLDAPNLLRCGISSKVGDTSACTGMDAVEMMLHICLAEKHGVQELQLTGQGDRSSTRPVAAFLLGSGMSYCPFRGTRASAGCPNFLCMGVQAASWT